MKPQSKSSLARNIPIQIAAVSVIVVCLAQALPGFFPTLNAFQRLEWMLYDLRLRLAGNFSDPCATNLAGVFITDEDIQEMNTGAYGYRVKFPWPTHFYGRVVRELKAQGASYVGFDVLFDQLNLGASAGSPDGTETGSDEFFALQLRQAGNVLLAAESESGLFPADIFGTNAAAIANIFTQTDADGVLRRVKMFSEYRVWHPAIRRVARALELDLSRPRFESNRIAFPFRSTGSPDHSFPLTPDGTLETEDFIVGETDPKRDPPFTAHRVWSLGVSMAARELGLDLANAQVQPDRIILRGPNQTERIIPVDRQGYAYIDWELKFKDPRIQPERITRLIRDDHWRYAGDSSETNPLPRFQRKLVFIGSTGTGRNIADQGATPLESVAPLITKHINVANSILMNRFIRRSSYPAETALILLLSAISALLSWKSRILLSSLCVLVTLVIYLGVSIALFVQYRYWLPLVLPVLGAFTTHFGMITYRVLVEQRERRRVRSIFSKIVSPKVVSELLKTDDMSVRGAQRQVTIYFADIRGFTRMTDEIQEQADAFIRQYELPAAAAEAYLDAQAADLLATVSLYLSVISATVVKHDGTIDKYIGDCVLAFWGAPITSDRHALGCVRAAIDAQRAIYELNLKRSAENKRREAENAARATAGRPAFPMLRLLALGSGISTGTATVGLMGSEEHGLSYTVLGRQVNLASRLEGLSGRARIIISEATYQEIQRLDRELASTCTELPPQEVKGFRDAVRIYEVRWQQREIDPRAPDPDILTGTSDAPATHMTAPPGK